VESSTNKKKIKKIAGIIGNTFIWVFVAFSVLITVLVFSSQGSADGIPALFGKSLLTIQTSSMEKTYGVGDMVFMTKLTDEAKVQLKTGEIVTYRAPIDIDGDGKIGDINTHRIVSHDPATGVIVTKGDNNIFADNEGNNPYTIHRNDVIGVCTEEGRLAGVGNVIEFLRSSVGFFVCIVLPLILFFLFELYNFISILVSEKAKKAPIAKETEEEIKRRAIEEYLKNQQLQGNRPDADQTSSQQDESSENENK
jgi:signal peptidase